MSADMDFIPAEAFPPGEFLRDELEERGWSQVELAEIIGKSIPLVNEIILGKRELTPATAQALAAALGTSAQYWLNLESAYRLYLEAQKRPMDESVARRAKLYSKAPVKELIKRGWIEPSTNIEVLEKRVCDFLGIEHIDDEPQLAHAARRSAPYSEMAPALGVWICRARQLARAVAVEGRYGVGSLPRAIEKLRTLLPAAPEAGQASRVLAECGIRLVIVETVSKAKVDGVTTWLDDWSPVVALSFRYDRIDWFWFTLMHELAHVHAGHGKAAPVIDDLEGELPESERQVNAVAQGWLISVEEIDDFVARTAPLYSRVKIANFARRIKVHPGVVVGQLQKRGELDWKHHRAFLTRVRDYVTTSTVTDGWGFTPVVL